MKIALLYGTESGNAEVLCEDMLAALQAEHDCEMHELHNVSSSELVADTFYVFVCSTFGCGDLPTMAEMFASKLEADSPDLSHVNFCIFGLGDTMFGDTFNQGSETLMNLLLNHGAKQIGERGLYDASSGDMPEESAIPWVKARLSEFLDSAA
ncbi:MAG: flavodoxin domain-containing protein [Pseudomonadota bacterium]